MGEFGHEGVAAEYCEAFIRARREHHISSFDDPFQFTKQRVTYKDNPLSRACEFRGIS